MSAHSEPSIAYLVAAHDKPQHLARLVDAVVSPRSHVYLHIDAKSDVEAFREVIARESVTPTPDRIAVDWGGMSQVEATIALLRTALETPNHDRFVLLSGSCFPVRSTDYIEDLFRTQPSAEFINCVEFGRGDALGKPITRLTHFHLEPTAPRALRTAQRGLRRLGLRWTNRDFRAAFGELTPFAGSSWWALTRRACMLAVDAVDDRPELVAFLRNSASPDETWFQTVIANSELRHDVHHNLTYTDWSAGGPNPAELTETHIEFLRKPENLRVADAYGEGEYVFARKFPDDSRGLIERLRS